MPDTDNKFEPMREPVASGEAKAKQPETEAERNKRKFEALGKEDDEQRSTRRHSELKRHIDAHLETVAKSHEMYPAPMGRQFVEWTEDEQKLWNMRRNDIDMANRAYHLAVRRTFEEHQNEEAHLARLRAEAVKKNQEVA